MSNFIDGKYIASGNDILDANFIAKESFRAVCPPKVRSTWTDANGDEHPEYYPHRQLRVSFTTSPMTDEMMDDFIAWFSSKYTAGTRCLSITAWCRDEGAYITQNCDVAYEPIHDRRISAAQGNVWMPMSVTLTGRGGAI